LILLLGITSGMRVTKKSGCPARSQGLSPYLDVTQRDRRSDAVAAIDLGY